MWNIVKFTSQCSYFSFSTGDQHLSCNAFGISGYSSCGWMVFPDHWKKLQWSAQLRCLKKRLFASGKFPSCAAVLMRWHSIYSVIFFGRRRLPECLQDVQQENQWFKNSRQNITMAPNGLILISWIFPFIKNGPRSNRIREDILYESNYLQKWILSWDL